MVKEESVMEEQGNIGAPPGSKPPSGHGNGNGDLARYRLNELERRIGDVEKSVNAIDKTCVEIKSHIKILMWALGILVTISSVVAHLLIRSP